MSTETTPPAQNSTASITSPIVTDGVQPTVTSPVVEPGSQEPVVDANAPPAGDPASLTDPNPDGTTNPDHKTTPEWAQKRINELTAKRYEAERATTAERTARLAAEAKAQDLLAQIARPGAAPVPGAPDPASAPVKMGEDEIERRAQEKAVAIAQANEFNKQCNSIVEVGKKEFKDWDEAVKNLNLVGALGQGVSPEFLETAVELKSPHKVLHYLGTNLEEAEKIAKLPPKRMALEMARVEALLNAPAAPAPAPAVSNAPPPVIPVGGAAKPGALSIDDPNLSTADFMAMREKQAEEKRNRYRRA
jgi:hypothetical protein